MSPTRAATWEELCEALRWHRRKASCEEKLNGILRKSPFLDDVSVLPTLSSSNTSLWHESWPIDRLDALLHARQRTTDPPYPAHGAIVVVRWVGADYLVDGRRRINQCLRDGIIEQQEVIVVEVKAGDI